MSADDEIIYLHLFGAGRVNEKEIEREYVDGSRRMTPQGMMDGYVEFAAFAELLYFCLRSRPLYIYICLKEKKKKMENAMLVMQR